MTHITCRLTAKNRDQLRNLMLGNRVWAAFIPSLLMFCKHRYTWDYLCVWKWNHSYVLEVICIFSLNIHFICTCMCDLCVFSSLLVWNVCHHWFTVACRPSVDVDKNNWILLEYRLCPNWWLVVEKNRESQTLWVTLVCILFSFLGIIVLGLFVFFERT